MEFQAVLFDLDGTLLDTLHDVADSANSVLARQGFPAHPAEMYREFIGEGVAVLFRRALPADRREDNGLVARCVEEFRVAYDRGWNVRTRPYAVIPELIDALTARGLALAVLSNKPDEFTRRCVAAYFGPGRFRAVIGQREGFPRKPDPAGALEIAHRLETPPGRFLYLGDSAVDVLTARRAGMHPVGALWGFRSEWELTSAGAEALVAHPAELLRIVDGGGFPVPSPLGTG